MPPTELIQEFIDLNRKAIKGLDNLSQLREEDIEFGFSEKEAVYQEDKVVLYHYKPLVEKPFEIPLLISYALVNRPYMVDLQENRSLVRNLLKLGIDVYIIDWGYPTRADRWITLDDYINVYIDSCVDYVREAHGLDKINLLGICQGGAFSLCYAALHQEKLKNLVLTVTPVDFHCEDGLLNIWAACGAGRTSMDIDLMVDALGNIPGDFMNHGFVTLKPFMLGLQKYLSLTDVLEDKGKLTNFMRMEKWIFDSPDQIGEAYREFMKNFYQGNQLIKGELEINGQLIDLSSITLPVFNAYAEQDHLVPPASTKALKKYIGTKDYTEKGYPAGHIGMYVSGRVQKSLPPAIAEWLKERA